MNKYKRCTRTTALFLRAEQLTGSANRCCKKLETVSKFVKIQSAFWHTKTNHSSKWSKLR